MNLLSPGLSALAIPVGLPLLRQFGVRLKYTFDAGHEEPAPSAAYVPPPVESVVAELEKQGIPSSEIAIFAKGKKDLLVPTADGVKEPRNRRVQIVYDGGSTS